MPFQIELGTSIGLQDTPEYIISLCEVESTDYCSAIV